MHKMFCLSLLGLLWGCSPTAPPTATTTPAQPATSVPVASATPEPRVSATPEPKPLGPEVKSKTGLRYLVFKKGTGAVAKKGSRVYVHYTGTLENGRKFDSSRDRGVPIDFMLGSGQVIQGWDEGLEGMKVGERRKLIIPPKLGYGEQGFGQLIPPNSTLLFDVELVKVE